MEPPCSAYFSGRDPPRKRACKSSDVGSFARLWRFKTVVGKRTR